MRLVYGIGATKAGSGWLYRFLRSHPECHLRTLKELHFFDTIEFGLTRRRLRKIEHNIGLLRARAAAGQDMGRMERDFHDWVPVVESGDTAAYLRYLGEGRGERTVMADITPSYSLVSADTLCKMCDVLPDTRFVFFMRDPVARLWSHIRMLARRAARGGAEAGQAAVDVLNRALSGQEPAVTSRGAYDVILPRLRSVVPAERLHVDFFEDTVIASSTDRLCTFLDISRRPALRGRPHEGIALPLAQDQRARMRLYLTPQYEFVRSEMGRLPAAWEESFAKE